MMRKEWFGWMKSMYKSGQSDGRARDGSALIVALWVVVLLSMIVGSFAFDMHVEARLTSYYRKRLKAGYLAEAGIENARLLLVKSADADIGKDEYEDQDAAWFPHAKRLARGLAIHGFTNHLDTGTLRVDIIPEPALRNINVLSPDDLRRIFKVAGIPEDLWDEMVDCFLDWIDRDDLRRNYGAETDDFYAAMEPAYRAKNGPLSTVDELLLIKGFTRSMLYGGPADDDEEDGEAYSGMADLLTIYGDGKVNVNAAPLRVLMTLPDMDEETARYMVAEREGQYAGSDADDEQDHSFKSGADLLGRVPNLSPKINSSITTGSGIYRITSVGDSRGVKRKISCIAGVGSKGSIEILRWTESDG